MEKIHPSICVSPYPTKQDHKVYKNEPIEKDVKFVQKVIETVRSTRADYNLPNKVRNVWRNTAFVLNVGL